ncbi:hypothetical protein VPH35_074381 [Triticum aestivum]
MLHELEHPRAEEAIHESDPDECVVHVKKAEFHMSRMLHEHPAEEADTSLSGELLDQYEHPDAEEADAAKDIHEYDPDECVVDVKTAEWHIQDRHEAKLLIEQLNQSGLGEDISDQEFLAYFNKLARRPPWFNLKAGLEEKDLDQQLIDHALFPLVEKGPLLTQPKEELHAGNLLEEGEDDKEEREYLAMLKEKQLLYREEGDTTSEEDETEADNLMDKNEADFNLEFLEENRFFISFEKDGTLDWFFHPAYCECASLSNYERLVLQNYGGTEYTRWSYYHSYLHSYDVEQEYVKYCEELSKQLKWMEDYIDIDPSSIKWDYVSSRGAYQAIKIAATSFPKITPTLAYNGYDECKESMGYHHIYLKECDGLYFEIWQRVKKGMVSVCTSKQLLPPFPLRQSLMQIALGNEFTMTSLEKDFRTCTAAIRPGVEEDEAKELIADAVKKRVDKPKFYDDYIRKKIEIAHIVGILPSEKTETDATV